MSGVIQIIPVKNIPLVRRGDDIAKLIFEATKAQGISILDGDIIVVTHKIVSKAEGCLVDLRSIQPSLNAKKLANETGKPAEFVELILKNSKSMVAITPSGGLIAETHHGWICANAGIDRSNVAGEDHVVTLPEDPDESARRIRRRIKELTGKNVAVIISDTYGRPFRLGTIDLAIGCAGIKSIYDRRGEKDLFGYVLKVKRTAIIDELASAAELVIGQASEGVPVAIIRGYKYQVDEEAKATELIRPKELDIVLSKLQGIKL